MSKSASSIKQWRICQRQWGRERIDNVKAPQGAKASLGGRCHEITEAYLRDGTAPNRAEPMVIVAHGSPRTYYPGRIALNIFHHLPPGGSVPRVEEQLDFKYRGIDFLGYVDWQDPETIGDHKFTSSLTYAMAAPELIKDPQAIMYRTGRWLESDQREVTLQWTYGDFAAKASRKVSLRVVRELDSMDSLIPDVEAMLRAESDIKDARDLPKTGLAYRDPKTGSNACGMYGGCAHQQWCGVTGIERTKHLMASAALEKLRAQRLAANGGAPATTQPATDEKPALKTVTPPIAAAPKAGQINPPGEVCDPPPPEEKKAAAPGLKKRGPGRPAKAPAVESGPDTTELPPQSAADTRAAAASDKGGLLFLFVDCVPVNFQGIVVRDASAIIQQAHKAVCEELDVDHYTFLDFGKGRGALAHAVGVILDATDELRSFTISTASTDAKDCLQAFTERAKHVIRGV